MKQPPFTPDLPSLWANLGHYSNPIAALQKLEGKDIIFLFSALYHKGFLFM